MKDISIIVPAYNAEKYLAMAVRSLRHNSKIDIERVDYE